MTEAELHDYALQVYAPERALDLGIAAEAFQLLWRTFEAQSDQTDAEPPFQILVRNHLAWSGNWGGEPVRLQATAPAMRAIAEVSFTSKRRVLDLLTPEAGKMVVKLQHHLCDSGLTIGFSADEAYGAENATIGVGTPEFVVGAPTIIEKQCNIHGHVLAVSVARPAAWLSVRGQARQVRVRMSLEHARWIADWISKPEPGRIRLSGRAKWLLPDNQLISFHADPGVEPFGMRETKDAEEMRQRLRAVLVDPYGEEEFARALSESLAARDEE